MQSSLRHLLNEKGLCLADLSRLTGLDKSRMTRWDQNKIPAEKVLLVEALTGIPRHDLRPDIYPAEGRSA